MIRRINESCVVVSGKVQLLNTLVIDKHHRVFKLRLRLARLVTEQDEQVCEGLDLAELVKLLMAVLVENVLDIGR